MRALAFLHLWQGRELGRVKQHVLGPKAKDLHVYSKPSKLKLAFSCSFFVFILLPCLPTQASWQRRWDSMRLSWYKKPWLPARSSEDDARYYHEHVKAMDKGLKEKGLEPGKESRAWRWQLPIPLFDQECRADEIDLGSVMHVRVIVYQQLLANRAYYKDFVAEYMSDFLHNTLQHGTWRDDVTLQASCLRWKCFSSLFLVMRVKPPLFPSYALYIRIKSTLFFFTFLDLIL